MTRIGPTTMYAAKRGGGNRMKVFSDQMRVAVQDRIVAEKPAGLPVRQAVPPAEFAIGLQRSRMATTP